MPQSHRDSPPESESSDVLRDKDNTQRAFCLSKFKSKMAVLVHALWKEINLSLDSPHLNNKFCHKSRNTDTFILHL